MKIEDIINLRPQCASIESGAEPSLKMLLDKYYEPHFPDNYQAYTEDYLVKLKALIKGTVSDKPIRPGVLVKVIFDSQEGLPDSFENDGVRLGDIGVVTSIDGSSFPVNVLFNDGRDAGFTFEELKEVSNAEV